MNMTVYELIQELTQFNANLDVSVKFIASIDDIECPECKKSFDGFEREFELGVDRIDQEKSYGYPNKPKVIITVEE